MPSFVFPQVLREVDSLDTALFSTPHKGVATLRWKYRWQSGKGSVIIAGQCGSCERWWGWVSEAQAFDLNTSLMACCPKCMSL